MEAVQKMPRSRVLRSGMLEARCEFLRLLRTPSFALPTLLFPPMFYLLFGVLLNHSGSNGFDAANYLVVSYSVFGVMAPGLFGFGVAVAVEREQGLLMLKRALPMAPGAYITAKMLMAMLFVTIVVMLLLALGFALGHVQLPVSRAFALLGVDVFGVLPFSALGLFVGTLIGGQGAPAAINLIYLPMAFLSGLWIPLNMLPHLLQRLAPMWPANHLFQIALSASGQGGDHRVALHAVVLVGFTAGFFLLAQRRLARKD